MTGWLLLLLSGALGGPNVPPPDVRVESAWIALGRKGAIPSDETLHAKLGEEVRLVVVVEARVGKERARFAAVPAVKRGGRTLDGLRPWPAAYGRLDLAIYKVEPDPPDQGIYDNTGTMEHSWHPELRADHPKRWHWCAIDYLETDTRWGSVWTHRADARPTTTRDFGGLGTMRYTVRVRHGGRTVWSRGKEYRAKGGIRPGVAMLQVRRDDTPVGWMTELLNVPYVFGSSTPTGRDTDHQTERAQGADCADMVVYGWRRAGRSQAYTWTGGLVGLSRRRAQVTSLVGGRYRTGDGRPISFKTAVQAGDLLLWRGHVAVIAGTDPSGFLTPDTPILHTVMESPALVPLKEIGFDFDKPPFEVRRARWEQARPAPRAAPATRRGARR